MKNLPGIPRPKPCRRRAPRGISALAAALIACACGARAPAKDAIPANALRPPSPRFVGRFDTSDPRGPAWTWSLSTIEARFAGSGIAMRLRVAPPPASREGDPPLYTVTVDDRAPEVLPVTPGEHRYVLATRLDVTRPHRVTIVRESEALAGEHQLLGFELVPGGELLATPEPPARRRIEIIGDSITCGYGILGRGADCSFSFATERASLAYGARLGRALDADVTTVCWSGRGVYRNYEEPDAPTMPQLWTPARVAPDAVVVNLGTNDVLAPRAPLDPEELERAYDTFLGRIREAYPAPLIVVVVSPMLEGEVRTRAAAILARVVERRSKAGDPRVLLVPLPEQGDRVGCDAHPNEEVHAAMAKELERVLAPRLR